jgi:AcrR family transcriptional regulator/predicted DNA-binding transcriptional regulator AlpA
MFFESGLEITGGSVGKNFMRISELSERSGVPKTTIHFYIREGLLHPPVKTGRTMAYYDSSHLLRLNIIQHTKRELGVPASSLKNMIDKVDESSDKPPASRSHHLVEQDIKDRRRKKIIDAAIQVFLHKGFHNSGIKEVARAAGISTGTFYLYFPDKRNLFVDALDKMFADLQESTEAEASKESDPMKIMLIRTRHLYRFLEKFGDILIQARAMRIDDEHFSAEGIQKMYGRVVDPIIEGIVKDSGAGILRKVDPELLAYSVVNLLSILSLRKSFDDKYSDVDLIKFFADLLSHGLLPGPQKPPPPELKT